MTILLRGFLALVLILPIISVAQENKYTVQLEMNNGDLIPLLLEVPANTRIRIEVKNIGTEPAEFESRQLRKEKVLAPGASSVVVIAPLKPGRYEYFDEFHMDDRPRGILLVKEP